MIRKHLSLAAAAIVAGAMILSCGKDKPAPTPTTPDEPGTVTTVEVESLKLDLEGNSISIAENAGQQYIDVIMEPKTALVEDCLRASVENEDIIKCSLYEHSIGITPKKIGSTKLTLRPKSGPVDPVTLTVTVTEKPAKPVSITIAKSGSGFADGNLMLTVDDTYTLSATTKDDKGGNSLEAKVWTVTNGDDVVSVDETSGKVKALKEGVATISVHPVSDESIKDEVPVSVTGIASVKIDRTGDHFVSGDSFTALAGESFTLSAKVLNGRGETVNRTILWKASGNGTIDQSGKVTIPSGATGTLTVEASAKDYSTAKSDKITVKITPEPTSISVNGLTEGTRYKKGNNFSFVVKVLPEGASQEIDAQLYYTTGGTTTAKSTKATVTVSDNASGGKRVSVSVSDSHYYPNFIRLSPKAKPSLQIDTPSFILDTYDKNDVKTGDYVYYNGNTSSPQFRAVDGGLRYLNPDNTTSYRWDTGNKPFAPVSPGSGWKLVGAVVREDLPEDNDFLQCSLLGQCKDGANATGLYEYRNVRKNTLAGFVGHSGVHALVICLKDSEDAYYTLWGNKLQVKESNWSELCEYVTQCTRQGEGNLYLYQLPDVVSLCATDKNYPYSGLLPSLLLRFYNVHLNDSDNAYSVQPITSVYSIFQHEKDVAVPGIESGKCTGWFLPGNSEMNTLYSFKPILQAVLGEAGGSSAYQSYWIASESGKELAHYFNTGGHRSSLTKNASFNKCHIRPVMYI